MAQTIETQNGRDMTAPPRNAFLAFLVALLGYLVNPIKAMRRVKESRAKPGYRSAFRADVSAALDQTAAMTAAIILAIVIVVLLVFVPIVLSSVSAAKNNTNCTGTCDSLLDVVPTLFIVVVLGIAIAGVIFAFKNRGR